MRTPHVSFIEMNKSRESKYTVGTLVNNIVWNTESFIMDWDLHTFTRKE